MITRHPVAQRLFDMQPEGSDISLSECLWAVASAENALQRPLQSADLDALGSRLSVPLLLLASTRIEKAFKWSRTRRWSVANELLECLREEGWAVKHA